MDRSLSGHPDLHDGADRPAVRALRAAHRGLGLRRPAPRGRAPQAAHQALLRLPAGRLRQLPGRVVPALLVPAVRVVPGAWPAACFALHRPLGLSNKLNNSEPHRALCRIMYSSRPSFGEWCSDAWSPQPWPDSDSGMPQESCTLQVLLLGHRVRRQHPGQGHGCSLYVSV